MRSTPAIARKRALTCELGCRMTAQIRGCVAGFGCRRDCTVEALRSLLDEALNRAGIARRDLTAVATIEGKSDQPAVRALAAELDLVLRVWPATALRAFEHRLTVHSERSAAATGCYGVAESVALATAEADGQQSALALPRISNGQATVALARYPI